MHKKRRNLTMRPNIFYILFCFSFLVHSFSYSNIPSHDTIEFFVRRQQNNTVHSGGYPTHIQLPYERYNRCFHRKTSQKKQKKSVQRKQEAQRHSEEHAQREDQYQYLCRTIEANFQGQYHEFKQYCEYEYEECNKDLYTLLNRNGRLEKRFAALQNMERSGVHYAHYNHVLSPATVKHLKALGYDVKSYKLCYGNQIQQIIHEDCITLLQETSMIPLSTMMYSHVPAITDCIDAAREYNQAGYCIKACTIQDFCWSLLEYGKAAVEGAVWGAVGAVQDCLQHPLHTAACVIIPEGVLVYQLSKVLVNVADIGVAYLFDKEKGRRKLHEYIAPVAQIIHVLQNKQLSGPEIVRGTAQLAIHWKAQNKLLSGLSKFYTTSKIKLEQFIKENPFAAPERYMTTPEGVLLRATAENVGVAENSSLSPRASGVTSVNHQFNFTTATSRHMQEASRMIPVQILREIIDYPLHVIKDPRGATDAFMHYSRLWKNGKLYNVEVLYDKVKNQILHFKYEERALGPLERIK